MLARSTHRPARLLAATAPALTLALAFSASSAPCAKAGTVELLVEGATPNGATVFASLCQGGLDAASCARGQRMSATDRVVAFVFPDVEPGAYAAVAYQDVDGTGELRRSRMGVPLEPYGLSNGAGRTRRPTFAQAAVRVEEPGRRIFVRLAQAVPSAPRN